MKQLQFAESNFGRRGYFVDFLISGRPLYALIERRERRGLDLLPRLQAALDQDFRDELLVLTSGSMPSGRVPLYVCPECRDYGCGVISVAIEREGDNIVWKDFAHENDWENKLWPIEKVGPFRFQEAEYRDAITMSFSA